MPRMNRREFIPLLGGAAAGWPLAARAQEPKVPVVGFLHSQSPEGLADVVREFRQGLKETGDIEGEASRSSTDGPRTKRNGCPSWPPI